MDQAVHTGNDLSKGAEGHQLDDLHLDHIANLVLVQENVPGVGLGGLVAQGDLLLLGIVGDDKDLDLVTHLDHLGGILDAVPGQLRDMHHAVHAANVHKGAIRGEALDNAMILLTHFDLRPDLLLGSLAQLVGHGTDGADHTAAGTVDLGNLHLHGGLHQLRQVAALGHTGLGGGDEHTDALDIGHDAALVLLGNETLNNGLALRSGLNLFPSLAGFQTLLGKTRRTLGIIDVHHQHLNLVADFQNIFRLHGRIGAEIINRDITCVLCTQVHLNLGGANGSYNACDLISVI